MRTSQAKRVCVYGWGGAREWYYWGGGQKSFHVVCTVCVCVCVCVWERERGETTACNKHKTLCWKRVISFLPTGSLLFLPMPQGFCWHTGCHFLFPLPRSFFSLVSFSDICRIKTHHFERAFSAKAYRRRPWGFLPWGSAWESARSTRCEAWTKLEIWSSLHSRSV